MQNSNEYSASADGLIPDGCPSTTGAEAAATAATVPRRQSGASGQAAAIARSVAARLPVILLLAGLASLVWLSFKLAGDRIYQVDECQNVNAARILSDGRIGEAYSNLSLFQLPLAWWARQATRSADLFTSCRFLMWEVYWLNLVLMVLALGERFLSRRGLIALLSAATLAPLWDYGMEIRHDNVLLSGLLLMWCLVRVRPPGRPAYFVVGCLVVALQFVAFKAMAYTLPISLAILVFPPGAKDARWKLALAWAAGALGMFVVLRMLYGVLGIWDDYVAILRWASEISSDGNRFPPWHPLGRLLHQTPLLLGLLSAALVAVTLDLRRRGRAALTWDGYVPEALLFLVAFMALVINPTPFPYNLVNWVPFAFLLAFRYASQVVDSITERATLRPLIIGVVVFAHLEPFAAATRRHWDQPNYRQTKLMLTAEAVTDPIKDPVYDGIGLVPTRRSIHFQWLLHSLNLKKFLEGPGPTVRDMLTAQPAAVIIPSYRLDWLADEDHEFMRQRYVSVADDFWVLGKVLANGGDDFEIVHAGRYRIATLAGSDLAGTYPEGWASITEPLEEGRVTGTLDGKPFAGGIVELTAGSHRLETSADCQPTVVWVGPHGKRLGRLGKGNHRDLFVNWY